MRVSELKNEIAAIKYTITTIATKTKNTVIILVQSTDLLAFTLVIF